MFLIGMILLPGFVGFCIECYTLRKDADVVLMNFRSSRIFARYEGVASVDARVSKAYLSICLASVVVWSAAHVRKGGVNPKELESLPSAIKKRTLCSAWLMTASFLWMCLLACDLAMTQWLRDIFR